MPRKVSWKNKSLGWICDTKLGGLEMQKKHFALYMLQDTRFLCLAILVLMGLILGGAWKVSEEV